MKTLATTCGVGRRASLNPADAVLQGLGVEVTLRVAVALTPTPALTLPHCSRLVAVDPARPQDRAKIGSDRVRGPPVTIVTS